MHIPVTGAYSSVCTLLLTATDAETAEIVRVGSYENLRILRSTVDLPYEVVHNDTYRRRFANRHRRLACRQHAWLCQSKTRVTMGHGRHWQ